MKTCEAIYSAFLSAEHLSRELLSADTLKRYGQDADSALFISHADKELHKLAAALGYRLEPIEVTGEIVR